MRKQRSGACLTPARFPAAAFCARSRCTPIRVTADWWPLRAEFGSANTDAEARLGCLQLGRSRIGPDASVWLDPSVQPGLGPIAEMRACGDEHVALAVQLRRPAFTHARYWPRRRIFGAPRFLGRTGRDGVAGTANTPAIAHEAAARGRGWIPLVVGNGISFSGRELLVWLCGQPCRPRRSSCDVAP
jgi:hypothetical protein